MAEDRWGRLADTYDVDHLCISGADLVSTIRSELARAVTGGDAVELGCGTGLYTPCLCLRLQRGDRYRHLSAHAGARNA